MRRPRLARDIMVTDLMTLRPQVHVCDGLAHLLRHNISGAPVVDEHRNYLGVFSEKCCMSVLTLASRLASDEGSHPIATIPAKDFMAVHLTMLTPHMDIVEAIGRLLKNRVSGAPVLDEAGNFLGVLSERYSMRVLIDAAYDQLPTSEVGPFMNSDFGRVISEDTPLAAVVETFLKNYYRRLVVLRDGKLQGQISRRDALRAGQPLADVLRNREAWLLELGDQIERSDDHEGIRGDRPLSPEIAAFMDTEARTITEDLDLLNIARIFLTTNYRRLPILRDGKLVGQVSRRDVLQATFDLMSVTPQRQVNLLYLSSLVDRGDAPIS